MQYVMLFMVIMALGLMIDDYLNARDINRNKDEITDLKHRVNILDEVVTQHSEELDELNRDRLPMANRVADVEKRMMEPSWESAVYRVQELEEQSGKVFEIKKEE